MHPAYSVIVFTLLSGAGYGLLSVGLSVSLFGLAPDSPKFVWAVLWFASFLILVGLGSSTLHLGRPERAWRAFSQWRSSWLSREAVAAVLTFAPIVLTGFFYFLGPEYWAIFALLSIIGSIVTVYCTSMIYNSLAPIPAWSLPYVPYIFIGLSLCCGLILTCTLLAIFGYVPVSLLIFAALMLALMTVSKLFYWSRLNDLQLPSTSGDAIGFSQARSVRLLESPHTAPNYLQREMVYRVARKHSAKLRRTFTLMSGATALLVACSVAFNSIASSALLVVATVTYVCALMIERWLFFAEARHTVGMYYGVDQ